MTGEAKRVAWETERQVAVAAACAAGKLARGMQGQCAVSRKADRSLVSSADHAADALILEALQQAFPADTVFSEEVADDGSRLQAQRLWVIDPIDGTQGFVEGMDEWAVHIALIVDGCLVMGVVALPAMNRCLSGIPGCGAWQCALDGDHEQELRLPDLTDLGPRQSETVILSRRQFLNPHPALEGLTELPRIWSHSVGVKVAQVVDGQAVWYVHPKPLADWDVAAPAAVFSGLGGVCATCADAPLVFNSAVGRVPNLLLSHPACHQAMIARLSTVAWPEEA